MEKTIKRQRIVILILVFALGVCFFLLQDLKANFETTSSGLNSQIQGLRNEINGIYGNVNEMLEKKASLLTSFDYLYGDLDEKAMKVPVSVKITPKSVSESTILTLDLGDKKIPMKKGEGTEFTAEFLSDLFLSNQEGNVKLIITNGGTSETEKLDWYISSLHSAYLPYLVSYFAFDKTTFTAENGLSVSGDIISMSDDEDIKKAKNIKFIYKLNGQVIEEEEFIPTENKKLDMIDISKVIPEAKEGDVFELLQEAEDQYGFIHRCTIKKLTCSLPDEEGMSETEEAVKEGEIILDKDGNILYQ